MVPGPDPLGGGLRATKEGVRENSLGSALRREGHLGTDCGTKTGALPPLGAKRSLSAQNSSRRVLTDPDTLAGGPEASAERVRTRHLSADMFCQSHVAEISRWFCPQQSSPNSPWGILISVRCNVILGGLVGISF